MVKLDDLISESQVYERWRTLFVDKELRLARQQRLIEWFDLWAGIHYTEAQLAAYIERWVQKSCEQTGPLEVEKKKASSKLETNGSTVSRTAGLSIATGTTKEQGEFLARAFER